MKKVILVKHRIGQRPNVHRKEKEYRRLEKLVQAGF